MEQNPASNNIKFTSDIQGKLTRHILLKESRTYNQNNRSIETHKTNRHRAWQTKMLKATVNMDVLREDMQDFCKAKMEFLEMKNTLGGTNSRSKT